LPSRSSWKIRYRVRSTTFNDDDDNLSNTPVGEDTAMSMKVACPR